MSRERIAAGHVAKGGGEVGANIKEINEGFYGRLINPAPKMAKPMMVVCSAPGKEPGVPDSIKLTDAALATIDNARKTGDSDETRASYRTITDRFLSLVDHFNLDAQQYEIKLDKYYEEIIAKKAHHGEPEIIMAHILADVIPGAIFIDPTDFLAVDRNGAFVFKEVNRKRKALFERIPEDRIGVMPGFVVLGPEGRPTTLGRGGSDATAGGISRILDATCYIYTSTDGILSGDPRLVDDPQPNRFLTFREVAEATLGGTYVVHEQTVPPLEKINASLVVQHYRPEHATKGTTAMRTRTMDKKQETVKIVTGTRARQTLSVVQYEINSSSGFVAQLTGILGDKGIPIHDIATATNSVTLSTDLGVDLTEVLTRIKREMPKARIRHSSPSDDRAAISLIGDNLPNKVNQIMRDVGEALEEVGVRTKMVSSAEDSNNYTVYVNGHQFEEGLRAVHQRVINDRRVA